VRVTNCHAGIRVSGGGAVYGENIEISGTQRPIVNVDSDVRFKNVSIRRDADS
jgi:hypothetical protein